MLPSASTSCKRGSVGAGTVIPNGAYRGLHNTDPFIFGERFLYSNCKQPSSPRLRSLDRGLGHRVRKPRIRTMGARHRSGGGRLRRLPADSSPLDSDGHVVPETFLDATGGPLAANSQHGKCGPAPEERTGCGGRRSSNGSDRTLRLYWGATPTRPSPGHVQFLPGGASGPRQGIPAVMRRTPGALFHRVAPAGPQAVLRPCRRDSRSVVGLARRTGRRRWLVLDTQAALPEHCEA